MQKRGSFSAHITPDGIMVDNLGSQPFLPWIVFQEAICVLIQNGGRAHRGNAMNCPRGDPGLSLDSIEDHIAQVGANGEKAGEAVFEGLCLSPGILIWAGICYAEPGEFGSVKL